MSKIITAIIVFIILSFTQVSNAKLQAHTDTPVIPGKLEELKDIVSKGIHVQKINYTVLGYRDAETTTDVANMVFELRYVFLNDEQKATFKPWDQNVLDIMMGEAIDEWIYENGIQIDGIMTREMVYSLTKMAREEFKKYPIYVIGFQPVTIKIPVHYVTEPGILKPGDGYTHDDGPMRKVTQ